MNEILFTGQMVVVRRMRWTGAKLVIGVSTEHTLERWAAMSKKQKKNWKRRSGRVFG